MEVIAKQSTSSQRKIAKIYTLCSICYFPLEITAKDIKKNKKNRYCVQCGCCKKDIELPDDLAERF